MKVAFRADASVEIGSGHVMRCLALAAALRERGAECFFVSPGLMAPAVAAQGFPTGREGDASDWLVVDHYGLDARWEGATRARTSRILAIDDLADRRHDCDILVDQNWFPDPRARYDRLVPERCRHLLGPRYALLREEFSRLEAAARPGTVRRILVSLGGTDPANETANVVRLLAGRGFEVDVVVGAANPHGAAVERLCREAGFAFHRQASNMAQLMAQADLAIGAGGGTTWERCRLGLPAIQLALAPNQEGPTRALADAGYVIHGGASLTPAVLEAALSDPDALTRQGERMRELVDGRGARRVAAAMLAGPSTTLALREARPGDARLYFDWANDPEVRRQSLDPRPIDWAGHHAWFARRLHDAVLLVAEDEAGMPVGQVRFERAGGRWRVNYSIGEEFRGAGLGARMMSGAITELRRRHPGAKLSAEVKAGNAASRRVFRALGFTEKSDTMFEHDA